MEQKVLRSGNSLAVTIPADFVQKLGIKRGQTAVVRVDPASSTLTVTFRGTGQMTLLRKT